MSKDWFTSDTHFDSLDTIIRENRPFKSCNDFNKHVISLWNQQVDIDDIIYHIGDFANYNKDEKTQWKQGLMHVKDIKCKIVLIIGNNEERIIKEQFSNSFEQFEKWCKSVGFYKVAEQLEMTIDNKLIYLNHYPKNHKTGYVNLFGHVHRTTGIWKPYGINVGCDLNHFYLYSTDEIIRLLKCKEQYWDNDIDTLCM